MQTLKNEKFHLCIRSNIRSLSMKTMSLGRSYCLVWLLVCIINGLYYYWFVLLLVCFVIGLYCYWVVLLLGCIIIGLYQYWFLLFLVFIIFG